MSWEPTRREVVTRAAQLAAVGGLVGIAGCGDGVRRVEAPRSAIAIDHASYAAPIEDLRHLVQGEAQRRGATVLFSADPTGVPAQQASLRALAGKGGRYRVVVVAPFDAGRLGDEVDAAKRRGVKLVSYIAPLDGAAAAISVDPEAAAKLLAADAQGWARMHSSRSVLLVAPPDRVPAPDPFLPYAKDAAKALANALDAAGLRVTATVRAVGARDAEQAVRARPADVVLTWDDTTARGAAAALPGTAYVGALGAPAVTSLEVLTALDGPGALRCIVAPRLSDLAAALVAVPLRIARGGDARSVTVPPRVLRRGSAEARAARADYEG